MGGAESYRAQGSGPGIDGLDRLYPGGPFDPLEFASDPDTLAELKVGPCVAPIEAFLFCVPARKPLILELKLACALKCHSNSQTYHL